MVTARCVGSFTNRSLRESHAAKENALHFSVLDTSESFLSGYYVMHATELQ